jgi:hypothetical protein
MLRKLNQADDWGLGGGAAKVAAVRHRRGAARVHGVAGDIERAGRPRRDAAGGPAVRAATGNAVASSAMVILAGSIWWAPRSAAREDKRICFPGYAILDVEKD